MRKSSFVILLLLFISSVSYSQIVNYSWERVRMDESLGNNKKIDKIIENYSSKLDDIMEVIGHAKEEITKRSPESALSNLAADMLIYAAEQYLHEEDIPVSLTNFGGIRTSLPEGPIRIYDVISVFPFENKMVILDIMGSDLQRLFAEFARKGNFQAMSNIEIIVKNRKLTKCHVGGEPIDPEKIYKFITIDFLLDGGDYMNFKDFAKDIQFTEVLIRNAAIEYIRDLNSQGVILNNEGDKRIIYE